MERKFAVVKINQSNEKKIEKVIQVDLTITEAIKMAQEKKLSFMVQEYIGIFTELVNS